MITHAASRKHYYTVLLDRSAAQSTFSLKVCYESLRSEPDCLSEMRYNRCRMAPDLKNSDIQLFGKHRSGEVTFSRIRQKSDDDLSFIFRAGCQL